MDINKLAVNTTNSTPVSSSWLDIINIENKADLSKQYADICQQHHLDNKWI